MALATKHQTKVPQHYKKRSAQHHRQNKHYLKSYWPYIPMLLVVAAGLTVNNIWSHGSNVLGVQSNFSSSSLLSSTNALRAENNETGLTLNQDLENAAQAKANDMVAENYWSHDSPSGKTPWDFITASGYSYQLAGENLAYGFSSASNVLNGWMASPDHRANVLDNNYQNVGFGVASSANYQGHGPETVVVAEYAQPVATLATDIEFSVPPHPVTTVAARQQPSSRLVSRVQLLTDGHASWSVVVLSALMGAAAAVFLIRHGLRIRKLLVRGEGFLAHHVFIDLLLVLVVMTCFVLTRVGGFTR